MNTITMLHLLAMAAKRVWTMTAVDRLDLDDDDGLMRVVRIIDDNDS